MLRAIFINKNRNDLVNNANNEDYPWLVTEWNWTQDRIESSLIIPLEKSWISGSHEYTRYIH